MPAVLIAFTNDIALLSFVIYYFMMITIPLSVLIRPHGLLCIDSIKMQCFPLGPNGIRHWHEVPRHTLSRSSPSPGQRKLRLPYRDGVWSTMLFVWQDPIIPPCIFSRKQQPEHTYAFGTVVTQLTPRMWGQAPTHLRGRASTQ